MKNKIYQKLFLKFFLLFSSALFCLQSSAQDEPKGDVPSFKMNGDVALLTNFVEHGLTQTNKDPSLQGAFGFNFGPQFKLGLWGSNVSYQSTEHFLLKINAELKVQTTATTDFKLGYFDNHYFKSDTRNGNTAYVLITSHGYRIRYESNSNWEGSEASAAYYSFGKAFDINPNWKWDNEIGYTMINDVPTMENYFDLRTSFVYKGGNNILYQITATTTSASSQFTNGQGDTAILLGASASF
jgi:uncharacterized protein (TIGR02001 family)